MSSKVPVHPWSSYYAPFLWCAAGGLLETATFRRFRFGIANAFRAIVTLDNTSEQFMIDAGMGFLGAVAGARLAQALQLFYQAVTKKTPKNEGVVMVHVWPFTAPVGNHNWGHVSLKLEDGTYISWWPQGDAVHAKEGGAGPLSAIFSAKGYKSTYDKDCRLEGSPPTLVYSIKAPLDQKAMRDWWNTDGAGTTWSSGTNNCATVIKTVLCVGGGRKWFEFWRFSCCYSTSSFMPMWTPQSVGAFAMEIDSPFFQVLAAAPPTAVCVFGILVGVGAFLSMVEKK